MTDLSDHIKAVVAAYERLSAAGDQAQLAALIGILDQIIKHHKNFSDDMAHNGETWLMQSLADSEPKIVFDVGANVGAWSSLAMAHMGPVIIHAFEIIPETFATLSARLGDSASVVLNPFGLGAEEGEIIMRIFDQSSGLSTLVDFPHGDHRIEICPVKRGDDYVRDHAIDQIRLMKMDVEGAENLVLEGFSQTFAKRRVDVVQFEYGQVNILTRFLLIDFYAWFEQRGYRVGKLYPSWVDFRAYDFCDEDFLGPNFVACRADRVDLIDRLSRK
jgi:FkbM family methyltransferase